MTGLLLGVRLYQRSHKNCAEKAERNHGATLGLGRFEIVEETQSLKFDIGMIEPRSMFVAKKGYLKSA